METTPAEHRGIEYVTTAAFESDPYRTEFCKRYLQHKVLKWSLAGLARLGHEIKEKTTQINKEKDGAKLTSLTVRVGLAFEGLHAKRMGESVI
jgi:hypothetical protein